MIYGSKWKVFVPLFLICFELLAAQPVLNKSEFINPPKSVRLHTWWHWMNGRISKEGITKDLESMHQQGIVQATILNVGLLNKIPNDIPEVKFGTPEWYSLFHWSLQEANRLGITLGIHNCDGWSVSGGPWIKPENSMKQYVWSSTIVKGGKSIKVKLPQPPSRNNFYRDAMIVAFPVNDAARLYQRSKPIIRFNSKDTTAFDDGNPMSSVDLKSGDEITIRFKQQQSVNKISLFPYFHNCEIRKSDRVNLTGSFTLSSSMNGKSYHKIRDFVFKGINKTISIEFPEVKAKFYKLECYNCPTVYSIGEIELLKENEQPSFFPAISNLFEKTESISALDESQLDLTERNSIKGIDKNTIVDISRNVAPDGALEWKFPKGLWKIIRFGHTTTGRKNVPATFEGRGLECDKMDTTTLNLHFDSFSAKLIHEAGEFNGSTFKFLLIDSWEAYYQNWTKSFPEEFKNRRGYDMISWIPVLCGETVEDTELSEGFLHDFQQTIADLISENYYKHFAELCHRNKLEFHSEVIYGNNGEYPFVDVIKTNNYVDLPMTEFWARPNNSQQILYEPKPRPNPYSIFPQFSAFEGNKQLIGSEAYTGFANYSESPYELKPFGDEMFCSGINQMILHSYVHQPSDVKPLFTLERYGAHFNRNNPWWEFSQEWLTYQARVQSVLQKGEPVADIIFYIGDELPQTLSGSIINELPYGFRAYPCNFDMLKNKAKVVDGKLSFGGFQRYSILALPNRKNMDMATLKRLAELVKDGLILYGPKPDRMLSMQDIRDNNQEFNKLADQLWGESIENQIVENRYGKGKVIWGNPINEVLGELKIKPDFSTNQNDRNNLMYFHKKSGNEDIFFVFNQQNRQLSRELLFRIDDKTLEIWDAANAKIMSPAIYTIEDGQTRIPITFKPYESLFFYI